ncbi:lipocalin-like domain-containing protein [Anabaena catenula]|uniref:Lipocalin-like domain-containing protein n=1 Tax=Anabaena catenula FACHB-362 TaxID=2692877 RepID=A0ABR8J3P3_9NOST|nr:lipocalin-like domain-containing protein [Anabaena catenula]MBD2692112.1 lipocalin-like domain-containing protein [Anabaena catenula FACHB-362]
MTKEKFVGTWKLVSWEIRDENGNVAYPFGKDAYGLLMYTEDGYMSSSLATANRPNFTAFDLLGGIIEEQVRAAKTYFSYCSKYEVKEKSVIHYVESSLFPNWVGTVQERFFEFNQDNQMILSTEPMLIEGKQQTNYLIWQHV